MTALSGLARNFPQLAAARIGVGVGEASASPAALLAALRLLPAARGARPCSRIYSSGIYIGAGLGLVHRRARSSTAGTRPSRRGARRSGCAAGRSRSSPSGLPGLLLALWVRTLREPVRGAIDGLPAPPEPHPFRAFVRELARGAAAASRSASLRSRRGRRADSRATSRAAGAARGVGAPLLTRALGDPPQWIALGVGALRGAVLGAGAGAARSGRALALIFAHADAALVARSASPCSPSPATASASGRRRSSCRVHGVADRAGRAAARRHGGGRRLARRRRSAACWPTAGGARTPARPPLRRHARARAARRCRSPLDAHDRATRRSRYALNFPLSMSRLDVDRRRRVDRAGPRAAAHARDRVGGVSARRHVHRTRARTVHDRQSCRTRSGCAPRCCSDSPRTRSR